MSSHSSWNAKRQRYMDEIIEKIPDGVAKQFKDYIVNSDSSEEDKKYAEMAQQRPRDPTVPDFLAPENRTFSYGLQKRGFTDKKVQEVPYTQIQGNISRLSNEQKTQLNKYRLGSHLGSFMNYNRRQCANKASTLPLHYSPEMDVKTWPWVINENYEDPVVFFDGNEEKLKACNVRTNKWASVVKKKGYPNTFYVEKIECLSKDKGYKELEQLLQSTFQESSIFSLFSNVIQASQKAHEDLLASRPIGQEYMYYLLFALQQGLFLLFPKREKFQEDCIVRGDMGHDIFLKKVKQMQSAFERFVFTLVYGENTKIDWAQKGKQLLEVFFLPVSVYKNTRMLYHKIRLVLWYVLTQIPSPVVEHLCILFLESLLHMYGNILRISSIVPDLTSDPEKFENDLSLVSEKKQEILQLVEARVILVPEGNIEDMKRVLLYMSEHANVKARLYELAEKDRITCGIVETCEVIHEVVSLLFALGFDEVVKSCLYVILHNQQNAKTDDSIRCVTKILYLFHKDITNNDFRLRLLRKIKGKKAPGIVLIKSIVKEHSSSEEEYRENLLSFHRFLKI